MTDLRASTVDGVLTRTARRTPDRPALCFADSHGLERRWSYAELDAAVSRAAGAMLAVGLEHGDRVATYGKNSDAYVIAFLACARAGLVHVPINYNLTGADLAYLISQSGSRVALVDPALQANVDAVDAGLERSISLRDAPGSLLEQAEEGPVPQLDVEVTDDDLVQLLYTSGTTSKPKGAKMTHRALLHEYLSCIVALDLDGDDDPLHPMPLYHSAQMHCFLMPYIAVGARNDVVETPDPADLLRRVEANRNKALFLAPTVWVPLANHPDLHSRDLSALRKAYYGASIMPVPVTKKLQATLPALSFYNCFGQSEIAPLATVLRPEEHLERPDSCGRPVLFVEMRVVDADGNDVAAGEMGEVIYRSPQLCTGYWDKPQETDEAFVDGWFHSGDLVRIDAAGYITVVDRIKDVINTGGVLVASREVEDALYTHPDVAEAAVIGVPDEKWIEAVTAVVVTKGDIAEPELIEHARRSLSDYKVPKTVHRVEELPRNASGKLLKRILRDRLASSD